jgi:SPP1 gp7 family putative phage head morphogenesis protein
VQLWTAALVEAVTLDGLPASFALPFQQRFKQALLKQVQATMQAGWLFTSTQLITACKKYQAELSKAPVKSIKPAELSNNWWNRLARYFATPTPAPTANPDLITVTHAPVPAVDELGAVIEDLTSIRVKPVRGLKAYEQRALKLAGVESKMFLEGCKAFVDKNIAAGNGLKELKDNLANWFPHFAQSRIDNIARTESSHLFNASRIAHYNETPAVVGYRFRVIDDTRTTDICLSRSGMTFKKGEEAGNVPPLHFRCRSTLDPIMYFEKPAEWTDLTNPDLLPPFKGFGDLEKSMPGAIKWEVPAGKKQTKPPFKAPGNKLPVNKAPKTPSKPLPKPAEPTPVSTPEPLPAPDVAPVPKPVVEPPAKPLPQMPARPDLQPGKPLGEGLSPGKNLHEPLPKISPSGGAGEVIGGDLTTPYKPDVEPPFYVEMKNGKGFYKVKAEYPDHPTAPLGVKKGSWVDYPFGDMEELASWQSEKNNVKAVLEEAEDFWKTGGPEVRAIRKFDGAPLTAKEYASTPYSADINLQLTFQNTYSQVEVTKGLGGSVAEVNATWHPVFHPDSVIAAGGHKTLHNTPFYNLAKSIEKTLGVHTSSSMAAETIAAAAQLKSGVAGMAKEGFGAWLEDTLSAASVTKGTASMRSRAAVSKNILKYLSNKYADELAQAAVDNYVASSTAEFKSLLDELLRPVPRAKRVKQVVADLTDYDPDAILPGLEDALAKSRGDRTFLRGDRDFIERHEICISECQQGWTTAEFRVTAGNGGAVHSTLEGMPWDIRTDKWAHKPSERGWGTTIKPYSKATSVRNYPKSYGGTVNGQKVVVSFCQEQPGGLNYWSNRMQVHIESKDPDVIRKTMAQFAQQLNKPAAFRAVDEEAEIALRQQLIKWADKATTPTTGKITFKEVVPGYRAHVEEGFADHMPANVTGVWHGTDSADKVASIISEGELSSVQEFQFKRMARHNGSPQDLKEGGERVADWVMYHSDANSGGAENCFTRLQFEERWTEDHYRSSYNRGHYQLRTDREIFNRMDWWGANRDVYGGVETSEFRGYKGRRKFAENLSEGVKGSRSLPTGNELMWRHGIGVNSFRTITCDSGWSFDSLCETLKAQGHTVTQTGPGEARLLINKGPSTGHSLRICIIDQL